MALTWRGSSKGLEKLWHIGCVFCYLVGIVAVFCIARKFHKSVEEPVFIAVALVPLGLFKLFFMVSGLEKQRLQRNLASSLSTLKQRIEEKVTYEKSKGRVPKLDKLESEFEKISKYSAGESDVNDFQNYLDQLKQEYPQENLSSFKETINAWKDIFSWFNKVIFKGKAEIDILARIFFTAGLVLIAVNFWKCEFIDTLAFLGWLLNLVAFIIFLRSYSVIIAFGGSFLISILLLLSEVGIVAVLRSITHHSIK